MTTVHIPRILLVEDEPNLAFNLQLNLRAEGYEVEHAKSGSEALEFSKRKGPFDLVLLDVMIPEPNGLEVAKSIRSQDEKIAIIMLTALATEKDRIHGLELGVDDYISKPFHLQELLLRVRRAVKRVDLFEGLDPKADKSRIAVGPYVLDVDALELT